MQGKGKRRGGALVELRLALFQPWMIGLPRSFLLLGAQSRRWVVIETTTHSSDARDLG